MNYDFSVFENAVSNPARIIKEIKKDEKEKT